jgi:hypothetical protein
MSRRSIVLLGAGACTERMGRHVSGNCLMHRCSVDVMVLQVFLQCLFCSAKVKQSTYAWPL